jgi:hypothetical protein
VPEHRAAEADSAGIGVALWRGVPANLLGVWVNGGALLLHGLLMVLILERVLG